jgi:hypothetical protein
MTEAKKIQYRFRVRGPTGKEVESAAIEVEAPPAPDPSARPSRTVRDRQINDPRWSDDSFEHGDSATVQVKAPGLDGRKVRFVVEHLEAGEWKKQSEHAAFVADGVAKAEVALHHPVLAPGNRPAEEQLAALGRAEVRFHAVLED